MIIRGNGEFLGVILGENETSVKKIVKDEKFAIFEWRIEKMLDLKK